MMYPPTKQQRKLEKAIAELTVDGISPSYDELAAALGLSVGAVRSLAMGLVKRGRARRLHGQPRSLELIKQKPGGLVRLTEEEEAAA